MVTTKKGNLRFDSYSNGFSLGFRLTTKHLAQFLQFVSLIGTGSVQLWFPFTTDPPQKTHIGQRWRSKTHRGRNWVCRSLRGPPKKVGMVHAVCLQRPATTGAPSKRRAQKFPQTSNPNPKPQGAGARAAVWVPRGRGAEAGRVVLFFIMLFVEPAACSKLP